MREVVDINPWSGAVETIEWDEIEQRLIVKTVCDVQPVLDFNSYLANHTDGWIDKERTGRLAARIPETLAKKWFLEYGVNCWNPRQDWPKIKKLLNSNEYRRLRGTYFHL